MPSTLEELLKNVIAIHKNDDDSAASFNNYSIVTDPLRPWSSASTRAALQSPSLASTANTVVSDKASSHTVLPIEIMQELKMPLAAEEAYRFLHQFYKENSHKPFLQLKCRNVFYLENDESQNMVRIFIGSADTLKTRGNDSAAAFVIENVFEYQQVYTLCENDDEHSTAVRVRKRKPEDFLSSPDRAQGKSIVPLISFSLSADRAAAASTFTIKPEYVNVKQWVQLQSRRQA